MSEGWAPVRGKLLFLLKPFSLVGLVRSSVNGQWHLGDGHSGCVMVSSRGFCSRLAVCGLT